MGWSRRSCFLVPRARARSHGLRLPARHCGYRPRQAAGGLNATAAGVGLAAALIVVGSLLPWVTVTSIVSINRSGIDGGGDGLLTLGMGLVLALVAVVEFGGQGMRTVSRVLAAVGGLGALGIAVMDGVDVAKRAAEIYGAYATASVGSGLFVVGAGGVMAALVATFGSRRRPA